MKKPLDEWQEIELGKLITIIAGQAPPSSSYNKLGNGLPFLRINSFTEKYPITDSFTTDSLKECEKGDILLSVAGTIGAVNIADKKYSITRSIFALRVIDKQLDNSYLFYFLKILKEKLSSFGTGTSQKIITIKTVNTIKIPFPPISIQQKIVSILDKVEKIKQMRNESDELTSNFLVSSFLEMFGEPSKNPKFKIKKLGDVCEVKSGGTPDRKNSSYWDNGNIPWVKTAEVNGKTINSTEECITENGRKNSNASIYPKNSLLIAMYGQGKTRGRVAKLGINASTNQACAVLLPSTNYNTDFLLNFLKISYINLRNLGRGGNQPNLNLNLIKQFEIILPPLELQKQFASVCKKIEELKTMQKKSKEYFNGLGENLLQKAFKGELVC